MAVAYLATWFMPEFAIVVANAMERFYACGYSMVEPVVLVTVAL